jgi:hypothetical protein
MADIEITVPISKVYREVARRSAVITATDPFYAKKSTIDKQHSQLQGEGDRITSDFTKEAAKEVLKAFLSRQGDVVGEGYEYDLASSGNIVYRFAENDDPLPTNQTAAITTRLSDNTEDAIIHYVLSSLYKSDGNTAKEKEMLTKALELINMLTGDLHRLHD